MSRTVRPQGHAAAGLDDLPPATLLARVRRGDAAAWHQLVDRYEGLVRSVAGSYRLQPADTLDVLQNTWLRVLESGHTITDPDRLAGWLSVTAGRECLRLLRRAQRQVPAAHLDDAPDTGCDPAVHVAEAASGAALWEAVDELPPRQRRLLHALFADGWESYQDVSAVCRMPVGSIGPTRGRALRGLREVLADAGLGPGAR